MAISAGTKLSENLLLWLRKGIKRKSDVDVRYRVSSAFPGIIREGTVFFKCPCVWVYTHIGQQRQDEFRFGLTIAGAISAGCYTGGAMDYLFELLEIWQRIPSLPVVSL
jgi:hypothetical protein